MRRVALATCAELPDLDEDGPALRRALERHGLEAVAVVWDDPSVDWAMFPLVVIRSTWDYTTRRDAFVSWAHEVARVTQLANPAPIVEWNSDKRYLRELTAAGLPVVPTTWVEAGDQPPVTLWEGGAAGPAGDLPAPDVPTPDVVVKPAVSAGARDTARYRRDQEDEARAHVARLLADGRTAMVQPYLDRVDEAGETAVIHLGGSYSHAIRKGPLLKAGGAPVDGLYAEEHITTRQPSPAELEVAEAVLSAVPAGAGQLLYARVDLLVGPDGEPTLIELELTEPSLFLGFHPDGADVGAERLAAAIAAVR